MQVSDVAIKFFRPEASPPFVNLYRLTPKAGILNRNPAHYHPDTIEIFAVFRGHLDWTVGDETHLLRPGDILVIPPNVVHGAVDANLQSSEAIGLHLAPEELPPHASAAAASLGVIQTRSGGVLSLIRGVFEEHRRRSSLSSEVVAALGVLLVSSLVHVSVDEEAIENSRLIRRAQKALMEKYGARPTVSEVADRLGISTVWLNRLFIRETGASPGDWARARRLAEAKRLLELGQLTTSEIALELGYSSGQVLATAFRKECGMTPSEYRAFHDAEKATESPEPLSSSMRIIYIDGDEIIPGDGS
jgi:AraC family transcriptional activator of pobA